jgi:two-component system, cell cycle sensor histidine kinase and response regulator CckA
MFLMLAQASLAMQIAFSCLLVCLLEFYYRRVAREAWLRWFAYSWIAQAAYVASLWLALDDHAGKVAVRAAASLTGYIVPPTFALTGIALMRGRSASRAWIVALYSAGLAAAAITFTAGLPYPIDGVEVLRIHNIPRYICYGLASLLAAVAFARHGRERQLTGSMITAGAWAFFGVINLVRAWQWDMATNWSLRGAESNPDLVRLSLLVFVTNSVVWVVMSIGIGLMLTESAERSERRARRALRELQESQTERGRLAQLVEQSRDAILVVSAGQLRYLNSAAANLLGYAADQIPSLFMKPLDEVCTIAAEDPMRTQMDASIAAAGVWEGQSEWRNRLTDERIPVLVGAFAMGAREGDTASTGLIGRDLRERVRLEEELRQAQRQEALGRLAGGIAHDFNNLLTVMMGYASLTLEGHVLSEPLRQNIGEILNAARRAAQITDRLRAFGRRQSLHVAAFDLNAVVDCMRGTLQKLVEWEVDLSFDLCPDSLPVRADAAQIEQVLMNLVLNARQAIDGRGRIVVRTSRANPKEAPAGDSRDFVKFEVEDSGSGIEPDVLEHIFDPYFTTRSAGTGLGLSMAYGIVRQSEGHIRVASRPGRGATFTVLLPAGGALEIAEATPDRAEAAVVKGNEVVMVVDDRPEVAGFVAACLEHYGYRVATYTDSESALAAVSEGDGVPHLAIRDVMMPGMPLREFADRLHALRPGLPMLLMSGLSEAALAPLIEGTGGYFIAKPFAPEQLAALVRRVLDAAAILADRR